MSLGVGSVSARKAIIQIDHLDIFFREDRSKERFYRDIRERHDTEDAAVALDRVLPAAEQLLENVPGPLPVSGGPYAFVPPRFGLSAAWDSIKEENRLLPSRIR